MKQQRSHHDEMKRTTKDRRPRSRRRQQEEVDEDSEPINKPKHSERSTTDRKKVELTKRREITAREPLPKKFEDKLVKRAKEQIKKKKDSETESTSQKRRRHRRSKVFECPEDCNAFCPKEEGKFCGYSCYRDKAHDLRDCRCRKHFDVKENFNESHRRHHLGKENQVSKSQSYQRLKPKSKRLKNNNRKRNGHRKRNKRSKEHTIW